MPLKQTETRWRSASRLSATAYRIPLPVTEVVLSRSGDSYPICPRCNIPLDREYMHFCDSCGQHLAWQLLALARIRKNT